MGSSSPLGLKQFSHGHTESTRYADQIPERRIPAGGLDTSQISAMNARFFGKAFLRPAPLPAKPPNLTAKSRTILSSAFKPHHRNVHTIGPQNMSNKIF
jgi:hypothetical protein